MSTPLADDDLEPRQAALRLQRMVEALERCGQLADDDARLLSRALRKYLAEGVTIEDGLSLKPRPGHRDWRTLVVKDHRNTLICEAANRFFAELSTAQQARRLSIAIDEYEQTAWRRERIEIACPQKRAGKREGVFWEILKANSGHVPSERLIRSILATS